MTSALLVLLRLTKGVIVVIAIVFLAILLWGVFSRYVLNVAIAWVEELAIFLMIWLVFLGISVAAHERGHIGMFIVRDLLPGAMRRWVILAMDCLTVLFLLVVAVEGTHLARSVIPQTSAALRVSFFWPYMSIPLGAALMLLQTCLVAVRDFRTGAPEAGGSPG
jgi:TRAP-type C4-dicarboxylate transport system permease small subunit